MAEESTSDLIAHIAGLLMQRWERASRNPGMTSTSDYLRPPYESPLKYTTPMSRRAAIDLERGFGYLPKEYQQLMKEQEPGRATVSVGALQGHPAIRGQYLSDKNKILRLQDQGMPLPTITADMDPRTYTHELVHAWQDQFPQRQTSSAVEEALARLLSGGESAVGNPLYKVTPQDEEHARRIDKDYRRAVSWPPWARWMLAPSR